MRIGDRGLVAILSTERNNFSWLFIQSLVSLKAYMGSRIAITYIHSGTIPDGRTFALKQALENGYDYVCMIDSDMTFPKDGIEILKKSMEKFDASIGCGLYFGTYYPYPSTPMAYDEKDGVQTVLDKWDTTGYIKSCGMGFTIITKDLFDIPFEFKPNQGEDHLFCREASRRGAKLILEPSVKCGHLRTVIVDEDFVKRNA